MKISWRKAKDEDYDMIESWIRYQDRKYLCMEDSSWKEVAKTLDAFTSLSDNGEFRSVIAKVMGIEVGAVMLGTTCSGKKLRIYNLVVNPKYREIGIGKAIIQEIVNNDKIFKIPKTYSKIETSALPTNKRSIHVIQSCGFDVVKQSMPKGFQYAEELNSEITFEKKCEHSLEK